MARNDNKPPKKAPPRSRGRMGVNTYDAELAELAQQNATAEESALGGGAFLSTKGGHLSFGGANVPGDKMNVVVIDSVLENVYYDRPYDPDNPASPVCYAFGRDEKTMAPHEKCEAPQNETCKGCPMNEWASADRGKGKACANVRRLALIPEGALDDVEGAEVAYFKVPVMSVKNWAGFVNQISSTLKKPPLAVVTELSLVPDNKSQFRIQFKLVREITDPQTIQDLLAKNKLERDRIEFPYQIVEPEEKPARGRGNRGGSRRDERPAARGGRDAKKPVKGQGTAGKRR